MGTHSTNCHLQATVGANNPAAQRGTPHEVALARARKAVTAKPTRNPGESGLLLSRYAEEAQPTSLGASLSPGSLLSPVVESPPEDSLDSSAQENGGVQPAEVSGVCGLQVCSRINDSNQYVCITFNNKYMYSISFGCKRPNFPEPCILQIVKCIVLSSLKCHFAIRPGVCKLCVNAGMHIKSCLTHRCAFRACVRYARGAETMTQLRLQNQWQSSLPRSQQHLQWRSHYWSTHMV